MTPSSARRRAAITILGALLGALALLAYPAGDRASASSHPPNIVVIMTDDQQARSMWAMPRTMNRLARWGVRFRSSFATYPLCCPSRATFLTGQYAHNHDVRANAPPDGGLARFKQLGLEDLTIAVALQEKGYRTGFVGKYLNGYPARARQNPSEIPPGWHRWFGIAKTGMFDWILNANGTLRRFGSLRRQYNTDVLARLARRFVANNAARPEPFFLTVMTFAPHSEPGLGKPRNPRPAPRHRRAFRNLKVPRPPSFNRFLAGKPDFLHRPPFKQRMRNWLRARHRARMASLKAVDDLVIGIINQLRQAGQMRNTYLIFTSDNGFLMGEHRQVRKSLLYEESVKVPLIIRGPGLPRGQVRPELTANIDLAPTILDVAGAEPLIEPDGVSLRDVIARPGRYRDREILLQKWAYGAPGVGAALRTPDRSYIRMEAGGRVYHELYNLRSDFWQLRNRWGSLTQGQRIALQARLAKLRDCQGRSGPNPCG